MFKVTVLDITTTVSIFQGLTSSVVLPGGEGELSILDFHQPIISCLKAGMIKINEIPSIEIKSGVAKMKGNELVILVEK